MHLWPFSRKPEPLPHVIVRHVAATKAENLAARQKATDVRCELAVYAATTTPEQRKADAERFHIQFMKDWPKLRATRSDRKREGRA